MKNTQAQRLHEFAQAIMKINANSLKFTGDATASGTGIFGYIGGTPSGAQIARQLSHTTSELLQAIHTENNHERDRLANEIEGLCLQLETVSVLTSQLTAKLIDMLRDSIKGDS